MPRSSLLVSLPALRTFEAVVRLGGQRPAAAELGLTISAVSHQIASLERALDRPLFERCGRRAVPTSAGLKLAEQLGHGFSAIEEALEALRNDRPTLVVGVHDTLAAHWLLPRLRRFAAQMPELDLRLATSARLADLERERIDCTIRLGPGGWPRVDARFLVRQTVAPLIRADKLGRGPFVRIVHERAADEWQDWPQLPEISSELWVRSRDLVIDAVLAGSGIAIADCTVLADHITTGELIPLAPPRPTDWSYYLLTAQDRRISPQTAAFLEWLSREFAGSD